MYGLFIVKLALTVVLAGGSQLKENENTITARSQPHLLLVGDPGTGKSQLLRFATRVIRRSVFTTGIGSTSAGLTVTAVMEDGEWQLEGGALVMADGGICCIDEFNSMKKQDRASIHEAMEQQTISVAKAGVVCKLHTRCTVIAATNPKCGIDATQPFGMNINIASPLLSRFDVVLHLKDKIDGEWDDLVADYVLNAKKPPDTCNKAENNVWNIGRLQSYFIMIKQLNPVLTPVASQILSSYYQAQRVIASRNKARTTVRLLDSLIRLSQGHARLMFHKEVQITDAIIAVILVEASLQGDSSLLALNDMNADFPENPSVFQSALNFVVLEKLDLMHLLQSDGGEKSVFAENSQGKQSNFDGNDGGEVETDFIRIQNDFGNSSVLLQTKTETEGHFWNENRVFNEEEESTSGFNALNDESNVFKTQNHDRNSNGSLKLEKRKEAKPKNPKTSCLESVTEVSDGTDDVDLSSVASNCQVFDMLPVLQKNTTADAEDKKRNDRNVTGKLEHFKFQPREVESCDVSDNAVDINQMLNMIPSVAEDFNMEEMDLDDISQQSFISDED